MTKKEINKKIVFIRKLLKDGDEFEASMEFDELISDLHSEKKYSIIVESFNRIVKLVSDASQFYFFELAFAYVEMEDENSAEKVYEHLIANDPDNTAFLNNLSNIKKRKRNYKEAFDLISKAYEIEPEDELITNNFDSLNQIIIEQKEREQKFKHSLIHLERENKFVIDKLKNFINNAKNDKNYENGILPIAKWKFKVFMKTDEQKADSLRTQWLDKEYIIDTGQRGSYYEVIYEINPYLEKAISEVRLKTINPNWIKGIENLNSEKLEEINYYRNLKKINRVNKKFKPLLKRDYDELTFNYLVKNNKSTIILAGSLIETLLIYYLNKKKIQSITYQINNRRVSKNLYEATLNDLLQFLEQNKLLQKQFVHLGNISRIFRNYIHPGKELSKTETLDFSKANLCYISACELINFIIL